MATAAVLAFARTHGLTITTWDLYQATWDELDTTTWQRAVIVDTHTLTLATLILIDGQPSSSSLMRYPDEAALRAAAAEEADAMIRAEYVLLPRPADTDAWATHIQHLTADLAAAETAVVSPAPGSWSPSFDTWLLTERTVRARLRLGAARITVRPMTTTLTGRVHVRATRAKASPVIGYYEPTEVPNDFGSTTTHTEYRAHLADGTPAGRLIEWGTLIAPATNTWPTETKARAAIRAAHRHLTEKR